MKEILGLFTLGVLSSLSAFAQGTPRVDLSLGYSMLRANSGQDISAFQMHGGAGTLAINFNQYLAAEFEFGGYHNGNVNNRQFDTTALTYVVGPGFRWDVRRRLYPIFTSCLEAHVSPIAPP